MSIVHEQRGNVFFYILLAVVLVAALSYAIATSLRGNTSVSNERQRLSASEIIEGGSRLTEAVTRMRLRGLPAESISFENDIVTGYTNAACTTTSCRVFSSGSGGGLTWETAATEAGADQPWGYSADIDLQDVGSTDSDLIAVLPDISLDTCMNANRLLGVTAANTAPPVVSNLGTLNKFTGTYAASPTTITSTVLRSRKAACVQAGSVGGTAISGGTLSNKYIYYQVLLAR